MRAPEVMPRITYSDDEEPNGYLESDDSFFNRNREAAIWFLEHRDAIAMRLAVTDADLAKIATFDGLLAERDRLRAEVARLKGERNV